MLRYAARFALILLPALAVQSGPLFAQGDLCVNSEGVDALRACDTILADDALLTPSETAAFRRARITHLLAAQDYAKALQELDHLADYDAADPNHHINRARALAGLNRMDEARGALDNALELDPLNVEALLLRATNAIDAGDADTAIADAGLAATLAPDDPAANRTMARALELVGATDAAERSEEVAEAVITEPAEEPQAHIVTDPVESEPEGQNIVSNATGSNSAVNSGNTANALELAFWNDVKDSDNPEELEAFVAAFPESVFVPLANLRIKRLRGTDTADAIILTEPEPEAEPEPWPILPPTRALTVKVGERGESLIWRALQIPAGDIVAIGGRSDRSEDMEQPWIARYSPSGTQIWEVRAETGMRRASYTDAIRLTGGNIMTSLLTTTSFEIPPLLSVVIYDENGIQVGWQNIGNTDQDVGYGGLSQLRDGGAILTSATSAVDGDGQALIIRLDASGNTIWRRELDLEGTSMAFRSVQVGDAIYVAGNTQQEATTSDSTVWLRKFNMDGILIWQNVLHQGEDAYAGDVTVLTGGNIIALVNRKDDSAVYQISSAGETLSEQPIIVGDQQSTFNIAALSDGGFAVSGTSQTNSYSDGSVGWVAWYDSSGRELARRIFGDDLNEFVLGLTSTQDDGLVLTGQFAPRDGLDRGAWMEAIPARNRLDRKLFTAENSGLLRNCVTRAAHPDDIANPYDVKGLLWDDFDAEDALRICSLAAAIFPENDVAQYHLGRAHHKLEDYESAISTYLIASGAGHIRADAGLGIIYLEGPEQFRNATKAEIHLRRASLAGDAIASSHLAPLYAEGTLVPKDNAKAVAAYRIAADAGFQSSQYALARHYRYGWGVPINAQLTLKYYSAAADQDHADAKGELAYLYHWGGLLGKDRRRAKTLFAEAAELGHADSILHVADAYRWGNDVQSQNYGLAAKWYQRAIDEGLSRAYSDLGFMHELGYGVPKDELKAIELYRKGVAKGHSNAEYNLGYKYNFGGGVTKNYAEAFRLYKLAVADGHVAATVELAYLYREGKGTTASDADAYRLFRKAGDKDDIRGLRESGWMQALGNGTAKNVRAGVARIQQAARKNDSLSKVYVAYLLETESEIRDPKRAARNYFNGMKQGESWPTTRKAKDWNRAVARELQVLLKRAGLYDGKIDGSMGPASIRAMKKLCKC